MSPPCPSHCGSLRRDRWRQWTYGQILSRVKQVRLSLQLQLTVEQLDLFVGLSDVVFNELFHVCGYSNVEGNSNTMTTKNNAAARIPAEWVMITAFFGPEDPKSNCLFLLASVTHIKTSPVQYYTCKIRYIWSSKLEPCSNPNPWQ